MLRLPDIASCPDEEAGSPNLFRPYCKWKRNTYLLLLLMVALKSRSGMLMSRANLSLMTSSDPCSIGMTSFRLLSRTSDPFTSTSYEDTNVIPWQLYFIIIQRDTDPRNLTSIFSWHASAPKFIVNRWCDALLPNVSRNGIVILMSIHCCPSRQELLTGLMLFWMKRCTI